MGSARQETPQGPTAGPPSLGFGFRMVGGNGLLTLSDRKLFGWVTLSQLEMEVPDLALPVDLSLGTEVFQQRRALLRRATLRVDQNDINHYVSGLGDALASLHIDEIGVEICDGHLSLTGRIRESTQVADLSAMVYLTPHGRTVRISVGHPRIYGHLDTPAPVVAHRTLVALLGADSDHKRGARQRGLGDIEFDPLQALLFAILPRNGWRLPSTSDLRIATIEIADSQLVITYDREGSESANGERVGEAAKALITALDRFHGADELLRRGEIDEAMRTFRGELAARGPEQPHLVERILAVASARRDYFPDGIELARQVLGRWPDFAPAHAAIASIATAQGDIETAAARYRALSDASSAVGDVEGTVRAALAGARLVRQFAPDESTRLYELVLDHRPNHSEAAETLADRYRDENRWEDLARLIRARLTSTEDPGRQARDRVRLAGVLFRHLGDADTARDELQRATELDPDNATALDWLAEIYLAVGERASALEALSRAADVHNRRGELRAEVRAHNLAGRCCLDNDDFEGAGARFRRALDRAPDDSEALAGAAAAAAGLGRHDDAVRLWRDLLAAGVASPTEQARYACELGRNLIAASRPDEARPPLQRAASSGVPETRAEAAALLAGLDVAAGNPAAAIDRLDEIMTFLCDQARDELDPTLLTTAVQLSGERAALLSEVGRSDDALAEHERTFALATEGSPARAAAGRILLDQREADTAVRRTWVDELLASATNPDDRAHYLLVRAHLRVEAEDVDNALADIESALALPASDDRRGNALAFKAELLSKTGESRQRADALAERADLVTGRLERAAAAVESAQGWLAADDSERAARAAQLALETLVDDDSDEGVELKKRALACVGQCGWLARRWSDVDDAYARLFALPGQLPVEERSILQLRWGEALEKLGKTGPGIEVLEQLVTTDQADAHHRGRAWRILGDLHERGGDHLRAAQALERHAAEQAVELSSSARADAWYRAGEIYRKLGDHIPDATRCLDHALELEDHHLPALDALERIARASGDGERVAVILGRKIAATTHHPSRQKSLLVRLAIVQAEELSRPDVAREIYLRALELDPDYRPALRFSADDSRTRGDYRRAAECYSRLAGPLPGDDDLPIDPEQLVADRESAAIALAEVMARTAGEGSEEAVAVLEEISRQRDDLVLLEGLEAAYRRRGPPVALADVLGRKAVLFSDERSLPADLERIGLLEEAIGDRGAALLATLAALSRNPDAPELVERRRQLDPSAASADASATSADRSTAGHDDATDPARPSVADSDLTATIRSHIDRGDWTTAARLTIGIDVGGADVALLEAAADALDGVQRYTELAAVLEELCNRARADGDRAALHRRVRRLADVCMEHLEDQQRAAELNREALELNPDDLIAAEIYADLMTSIGSAADGSAALERVLEIARRTDAGPNEEARALRQLARSAAARGELDTAASWLDQACQLATDDLELFRERSELALTVGDHAGAARSLEVLAGRLESGTDPGDYRGSSAGDVLLQLADIYYDQLGDLAAARACMKRAAEAFGAGTRREAVLRLLASESASAGALEDAAWAYDAIGTDGLTPADAVSLAKVCQRLGRDKQAIDALESARARGTLSEEASMLLFALHRHRKHKADLARSLEHGAMNTPPGIATTRLIEALKLQEDALGDEQAAQRIRERLARLAPGGARANVPTPSLQDLERAAEAAITSGDDLVTADLVSRVIEARARDLAAHGRSLDSDTMNFLNSLRDVVERLSDDDDAAATAQYESLVRALLAASAVEGDRQQAAGMLREVAAIRSRRLADARGAADALARALALRPDDPALLAELDAVLRDAGDYSQLVSAYELHLATTDGPGRARTLYELGRIHRDIFREEERARGYFEQAASLDPGLAAELDQATEPSEGRPAESASSQLGSAIERHHRELQLACDLEASDKIEAAIVHYEAAAELAAKDDTRALESLERLYQVTGDLDALSRTIARVVKLTEDRRARARLLVRLSKIQNEMPNREADAYRYLKEAFANDPDDGTVAYSLRAMAMARGEWALAAELIYREISAASSPDERAALYLELALIYDEKLLEPQQATINYEQALELDPEIPAALRPLARLYELAGRCLEAAELYERAAERTSDGDERSRCYRQAASNAQKAGRTDLADRLQRLAVGRVPERITSEGSGRQGVARRRDSSAITTAVNELTTVEAALLDSSAPEERAELHRRAISLAVEAADRAVVGQHARALLTDADDGLSYVLEVKARAAASNNWDAVAAILEARASVCNEPSDRAALYYELGRIEEIELGDRTAAAAAYENALIAEPEQPGALEAAAEMAYQRQDWQRALDYYQRLTADRSSLPEHMLAFRRGELAETLGRDERACDYYQEAVDLFPSDLEALAALSRTALLVGNTARAIEAQRSLLGLIPAENIELLTSTRLRLADLCRRAGETTKAIYYYEQVLAEEPSSLSALYSLASLYRGTANRAGAVRVLRSLIALGPAPAQRADFLYQLGELYREGDIDPELAADAYLKAIDLDPDHAPTMRRLLDYYWRSRDDGGLIDMASELHARSALLAEETGLRNLCRVALAAILTGNSALASDIAESLGPDASEDLAGAVLESTSRNGNASELATAVAALCASSKINLRSVIDSITERSSGEARDRLLGALHEHIST